MALLSIASCRLAQPGAQPGALEAQGAAQRARQLFQALRHRRGRLRSLELLQQAMGFDGDGDPVQVCGLGPDVVTAPAGLFGGLYHGGLLY